MLFVESAKPTEKRVLRDVVREIAPRVEGDSVRGARPRKPLQADRSVERVGRAERLEVEVGHLFVAGEVGALENLLPVEVEPESDHETPLLGTNCRHEPGGVEPRLLLEVENRQPVDVERAQRPREVRVVSQRVEDRESEIVRVRRRETHEEGRVRRFRFDTVPPAARVELGAARERPFCGKEGRVLIEENSCGIEKCLREVTLHRDVVSAHPGIADSDSMRVAGNVSPRGRAGRDGENQSDGEEQRAHRHWDALNIASLEEGCQAKA